MSNNSQQPDWFQERLEAYVDGELSVTEAQRFDGRLADDAELRQAVANAQSLQRALRRIQSPRAPAAIRKAVVEQTGTHWITHRNAGWLAATAATLALAISLIGQFNASPQVTAEMQLTAREIAKGRQDLALALAYLDQATVHTSRKVSNTWVNDGLLRPVSSGLNRPADALERLPVTIEDEV